MTKTRDLADLGGGFIQAGTGAVQRTVEAKLQDTVSVKDFGAVGDGSVDDSPAFAAALTAANNVFVPSGTYRCDAMIEISASKCLRLDVDTTIKRTTDTANTDPVIWIKGQYASLLGSGRGSFVRSDNASPLGVVRLGHKDDTESHANVLYCTIKDLSIFGKQPYGQTSGSPDCCLYMNNPQIGGVASYFHSVHNVLFAYTNIGVWLRNNANANTLSHLQFYQIGGNNVGVTNAAIYLNGAKENLISHFFVHFSPDSITLKLENTTTDVQLNKVVDWVSEPGTGGTAQGMVVTSCGIGNDVAGILNGISNSYGTAGTTGWFGANRRNSWRGANELYSATPIEIKCNSPNLVFDDTYAGGSKYTIINGAHTLRVRKPDSTDAWIWNSAGTMYPATDNVTNLGAATFRVKEIFAGIGAINTSDAREKSPVRSLTAAELAAAKDLSKEIGVYQFLKSIEEKGDKARHHIGMTVQRCIEIMKSHGLDAFNYGFVCYDSWEAADEVIDAETGEILTPALKAGDRYGFRYDQLLLFVSRGFEARLSALEHA